MRGLLLLVTLALASSCNQLVSTDKSTLPISGGVADEVMVVGDQAVWDGPVGDALRKLFETPFPITPQFESTIKVSFVPYDKMSDLLRRHRNILFIADLSSNTATSDFVVESLGEEYTSKALLDPTKFFATQSEVWARPQQVMVLFGNSQEQMVKNINERGQKIVSRIQKFDMEHKYMPALHIEEPQAEITDILRKNFGFTMYVPSSFYIAKNDKDLLWLRRDIDKVGMHVFIYTVPLDSIPFTSETAIKLRDQLGKLVSSEIDSTYMVSDTVLPFEHFDINVAGLPAIDTRGLWSMENDFMGGPFINYLLLDTKNKRLIMLDGFIYAPGEKKKIQLRYLQAMFSTLKPASKQGV